MSDYLRLALATAVVLAPGLLIARALGQRSASAALAWGLTAIFLAWAVVFAVHGDATLALGVLALVAAAAVALGRWPVRRRTPSADSPAGVGWGVLGAGILLGMLLWRVASIVSGDGLFHLARVRKLVELGELELSSVGEFADGGLHPGYAFPLWHGFLALVAKVSGLDPEVVVRHEPSILAPLAVLVAWEAGAAVFRSTWAGVTVAVASFALLCLAPGRGGAFATLALPATASRVLLVPAVVALFFRSVRDGRPADLGALAAAFGALALVHPTYALFTLVPLVAYALVRLGDWGRSALALAAATLPTALAFAWLLPIVRDTRSHDPDPAETARALRHYASMLDVSSPTSYHLRPEVVGRTGAVAVAALLLVPLAGLAVRRRRWAALVLGGTVAVLALLLVPFLFTHLSDAVSLSQSRRAAAFVPLVFAFAGGLALLVRSALLLPLALVAGILAQRAWPGDFGYGLADGGPALATWIALLGGAAALVLGLALRTPPVNERHGLAAIAAALVVLPIALDGFRDWNPRVETDPQALSPTLVEALRELPPRTVVIASPQISYRALAAAPIYVVAAPPTHVADTEENRPYARARDVREWLATGDPEIPRRYGAEWAVVNGDLRRLDDG